MHILLYFHHRLAAVYGLKTRAEVAAMKAEEEDKGKKKGKRSARSKTPKSAGKKGSAATEKKGICLLLVLLHINIYTG